MPTFEIQANGKTFEVDAPDQQTALSALGGQNPVPAQGEKPNSFIDAIKSIPGALARGVANTLADTGAGDTALYMTPEQTAAMPTREQSQKIMEEHVTGPLYKPQTAAGRIVSAGVENLGNPVTYIGPGGLLLKMGGGFASGAASEAAGEATKGTEYEGPARLAAALGGGVVAGKALSPSKKPSIPTAEELRDAADQGYNVARNSGLEIKPSSVSRMATEIKTELNGPDIAVNAKLAPKTFAILDELQNPPSGSVATVSNFETARRALGHAAKDFQNPTEQLAASKAISRLDEHLANLHPSDALAGDATKVAAVLSDARGNYAAAKRAEQVSDALEKADLTAAAANSGQNVANRTRQTLRQILTSDKQSRGFSDAELEQVERTVRGTGTGNTARRIANLLGAGGGLGQLVASSIGAAGGSVLGPAGAAVGAGTPVVMGAVAKGIHNASTARQARILDEMIRARSPLAESRTVPIDRSPQISALARALLTAR